MAHADPHAHRPDPDGARPELTLRAILTGIVIGALLTPCNIYSGLKIGWAFNMSIAAGLLAWGFWRLSQRIAATRQWDILENNINQTAASAAASIISGGLVAPIPALTLLTGQTLAWHWLSLWVFAVSALGIVVAAGLRNQMLLRERLAFPAGIATAETMTQIHGEGAEALARLRVLFGAAAVAGLAKGIDDLLVKLPRPGPSSVLPWAAVPAAAPAAAAAPLPTFANLGFILDPSLLMLGFGAIIGLRAGLSILLGAVFAWGLLAPWLVARGWAEAGPADADWFAPLVTWLLWPGVTMMVVASLLSFAFSLLRLYRRREETRPAPRPAFSRFRGHLLGFCAVTALIAFAAAWLFGIGLWQSLLAAALSYVLAVVAARVTGETGITPIGAMGKVTQLAYGLAAPGNIVANLMSANITGGAAGQCADLMQDLKTGLLVGATPRFQIVAQVFGIAVGALVGSAVYLLLIPDPQAMLLTAEWPAPAVATWKAVAEVLAEGIGAIPPGAVPAMGIAAAAGALLALSEVILPDRLARRLPSAPAMGLAFVLPAWNAISLCLGALLARLFPHWAERRTMALAAGLVAGESLVGIAVVMTGLFS